jgi:hypothetical protein
MKAVLGLLMLIAIAPVPGAADATIRAGVVARSAGSADTTMLLMSRPILTSGTRLTLVTPDAPQKVQKARVERVSGWRDLNSGTSDLFYEIVADEEGQKLPELAIAVVGDLTASRVADAVSLHVDATLKDVRARACRSMEGIHLTLWAGEPLKAPRLWHFYHYVGYDMVPDCLPADTDGGVRLPNGAQ